MPLERKKEFIVGHGFIFPFLFHLIIFLIAWNRSPCLWDQSNLKCTLHIIKTLYIIFSLVLSHWIENDQLQIKFGKSEIYCVFIIFNLQMSWSPTSINLSHWKNLASICATSLGCAITSITLKKTWFHFADCR